MSNSYFNEADHILDVALANAKPGEPLRPEVEMKRLRRGVQDVIEDMKKERCRRRRGKQEEDDLDYFLDTYIESLKVLVDGKDT